MQPADYLFHFDDLCDSASRVQIAERHTGRSQELPVTIDDSQFPHILFRQIPSLHADLIDLAIAVHVADRFAIGRADLPRRLRVQLPLRNRELFDRPTVVEKLREILLWYTDDQWEFVFTSRQASGRIAERQGCLALGEQPRSTEVALWSGGLDSLAGLIQRMSAETAERYLVPSTSEDRPYRFSTGNHLRAMLWQVRAMHHLLSSDKPWDSLARYYPRLIDIIDRTAVLEGLTPERMQDQFVQMYQRYVHEWEQVRPYIERGLLGDEELREAA